MKTFIAQGRTNFVDDNNVFVGFNDSRECCEYVGHQLSPLKEFAYDSNGIVLVIPESNAEGYNFDTSFYETSTGEISIFRLVKENSPDLFLILYNICGDGGFYSHGFTFGDSNGQLFYNGEIGESFASDVQETEIKVVPKEPSYSLPLDSNFIENHKSKVDWTEMAKYQNL